MSTDQAKTVLDLLDAMDDRRGEDCVLEDLSALISAVRKALALADDWTAVGPPPRPAQEIARRACGTELRASLAAALGGGAGAVVSDGHPAADLERAPNRWGFSSFVTEEAVRAYCRKYPVRSGGQWRIWRLADGTFDYTSTDVPRAFPDLGAELVGYQEGLNPKRGKKVPGDDRT
jgi:hypothetical protein